MLLACVGDVFFGFFSERVWAADILIYTDPKPQERNPGKMTCTTASGLLPAGIAVYVQREPNGVRLETRYPIGL